MSVYYVSGVPYTSELYHHGILGQKWGIRRYQNEDGSLTELGRIRYSQSPRNYKKDLNRLERQYAEAVGREDMANFGVNHYNRKAEKIYKRETGRSDLFDGSSLDVMIKKANQLSEKSRNKLLKIAPKILNEYNVQQEAIKQQRAIESDLNRLMASALSQNYSVTLTPKALSTQSRIDQLNSFMWGLPYRIVESYIREGNLFVPGYKYNVSKNTEFGATQGRMTVRNPSAYQQRLMENSIILRNRSRSKAYR